MLIDIEKAVDILNLGGNVIIPTETVYGLAGSIKYPDAIDSIYRLKGRPRKNPLIVHVSSLDQALDLVEEPPKSFFYLVERFWPGPLTLILKAKNCINRSVTGGLSTIAIRMPNHPSALELIQQTGPLAAPSANLSGKPSGTRYAHLETDFGVGIPVLKGDEPIYGVESTILGWINESWNLLRLGYLSVSELGVVLNENLTVSDKKISPGSMFKHYSPNAKLLINRSEMERAQAILGYENRSYPHHLPIYSLGRDNEPELIAHRLYDLFRKMDDLKFSTVWVDTELPDWDLYHVILERIKKAATSTSVQI